MQGLSSRAKSEPVASSDSSRTPDYQTVVRRFNATDSPYPQNKLLHVLFEEQVERTPEQVALVYEGRSLTYFELNCRANQLAWHLRRNGVGPEQLVAICVERNAEMVVGLLGILKAGAAYVPLDPGYPAERLAYMVRDAAAKILLTQEHIRRLLPSTSAEVISLDENWEGIASNAIHNLDRHASDINAKHLAYVIYTSGSTGLPKGAMNEHAGVVNRLQWMQEQYQIDRTDRVLQKTPFSFDVSVWEFFWTLTAGAQLIVARPESHKDPFYLQRIIEEEGITTIHFVPSMLQSFLSHVHCGACPSVRHIVCSGEELPAALQRRCFECFPDIRLSNLYGPTEAAVDVTVWECSAFDQGTRVPIGHPIANIHIYVLDEVFQPVAIGAIGDLYIGGIGVGRGYLNRPQLTADRFLPDPFGKGNGLRLYKTGDLGRWRPDGAIEYLGRSDHQVKIRGFRIELGEIEAQLAHYPGINETVVLAREDVAGEKRLAAYFTVDYERLETTRETGGRQTGTDIVAQWRAIYEETYSGEEIAPSFVGWNSSYTGLPIPEGEMQEWLENTLERIRALRPRRVLEIGCGVGLLLQQLGRECEVYHATDFSIAAIDRLQAWLGERPEFGSVRLEKCTALEVEVAPGSYDTVILNSVIQYFPDLDYLWSVLCRAVRWVGVGGRIFIGDVRHLGLLRIFHSATQLERALADGDISKVKARAGRAIELEKELVVDPRLFHELRDRVPGITDVIILLKRGTADNELTLYRYDVVLEVGEIHASQPIDSMQWRPDGSLVVLAHELERRRPRALRVCGVPNRRLARDRARETLVWELEGPANADLFRNSSKTTNVCGETPEDFWRIGEELGYAVTVTWNLEASDGSFDAEFLEIEHQAVVSKSREAGDCRPNRPQVVPALQIPSQWCAYVTNPLRSALKHQMVPRIRAYLTSKLPPYMVPSAVVMMDRFPLTPNGKLDRRGLPAPDFRAHALNNYEAPEGELEEVLADLWQELLGVEFVGRSDNFFEIGGHSLLIVRMVQRLHRLGFAVEAGSVFECPTLKTLAKALSRKTTGSERISRFQISESCEAITPQMLTLVKLSQEQIVAIVESVPGGAANVQDIYPLTSLQEGMLFHHLLDENKGDTYILLLLYSFASRDRVNVFVDGLQAAVDRHDILRTALRWQGLPRPVQVVHRRARMPVIELTRNADRTGLEQIKEQMKPGEQVLNLQNAPLMRLQLLNDEAAQKWYGLLQVHHLILDHGSLDMMLDEVIAHVEGRDARLPRPAAFREYLARVLASNRDRDDEAFFRAKLGDVQEPTAPFNLTDVHGNGSRIEDYRQVIAHSLAVQVREGARRMGVSVATLVHAAWALVISRLSGRDDVIFGTILLGQLQGVTESERALGMFINTLPLRLKLSNQTARDLIRQTQRELAGLLAHEPASLTAAQRSTRLSGSAPLFTSLLNYLHGAPTPDTAQSHRASGIEPIAFQEWSNYPIAMSVADYEGDFVLTAQTDRRISPRRLVGYLCVALNSLVRALDTTPGITVQGLDILPDAERNLLIHSFNATVKDYDRGMLIHQLIEEQARQNSFSIAVQHDTGSLTYADLNRRANQLGRYLRARGFGAEQVAAVCLERGFDLIVALLGILKAGGAYLPIDPNYPVERIRYLVADSSPRMLLTQKSLGLNLCQFATRVIAIDDERTQGELRITETQNLDIPGLQSHQQCYVIYTSGSTGEPKGVTIEHRNLHNLVAWHIRTFGLERGTRSSSMAGLGFDASTWEVWPPLCSGGTLILPASAASVDSEVLLNWWQRQELDVSFLVTPLAEFAYASGRTNVRVQELLIGGDRLRRWPESLPDGQRLVNNYGPTETAVVATSGALTRDDEVLHIGRPIDNNRVYIVDDALRPVPIEVAGELLIGGASVGRGYLNKPALTAERFIADPFYPNDSARVYRTGDLARWLPDGRIEYLGRNDTQVKIRGFRIELGEIEIQLANHWQVKEAVVVVREDVPGERRLVAYLIRRGPTEGGDLITVEALRAYLKARLPTYMVPTAFHLLESFPLSPNGKIDRKALPPPEAGDHSNAHFELPCGELEQSLAEIWRNVLRTDQVGRQDNFFELGGHSLLVLEAVSRIRASLDLTLKVSDLYRFPTIQDLAAYAEGHISEDRPVELCTEALLGEAIVALPGPLCSPSQVVLVTGATGFVGRFLVAHLLRETDVRVLCLVRAQSATEASWRLKNTLGWWDLWRDDFAERVVAIPGDLRKPQFGIAAQGYESLCSKVDCIYHCGASMNHLESYGMAKPANVEGVREILRLATRTKPKLVNYVSSLGVFRRVADVVARTVQEESSVDHEVHYHSAGYVASKWVGEKIVMVAREGGIPCNIFRLGLVWADTQQGRYDELQREYRMFKSCLLSGYAIRGYKFQLPPTPVDYVARAIATLASKYKQGGGTFHISAPPGLVDDVFERSNAVLGTAFELKSFYEWVGEIKRLHAAGLSMPAVPLLEQAFALDEVSFEQYERALGIGPMNLDCTQTWGELEAAGVVAPVVDDELLHLHLESMLARDTELHSVMQRTRELRRAGRTVVYSRG